MREGAPPLGEALNAFYLDLELAGRSPATLRSYRSRLKPLESLHSPTAADLGELLLRAMRQNIRSAYSLHTAFSSFFAWCERKGLSDNLMKAIPRPRQSAPDHRYLSKDQVVKVYAACKSDTDRLIIRLLLLGLRAGELLAIRWADIEDHELRLTKTKGRKPRRVWLDDETVRLLEIKGAASEDTTHGVNESGLSAGSHLADAPPVSWPRRKSDTLYDNHASFGGASSTTIIGCGYMALRERLMRISRDSRVPFTAHTFRRTFASHAALAGMNVASVQRLGGWSKPDMAIYYSRSALDEAALRDAERFNLTARLLDQ